MTVTEPLATGGVVGRYQFVEPQGGCIVPRMGDLRRSAAILGQSAKWRGEVLLPRTALDPAWIERAISIARGWYDGETEGDS
jgi:hypothetical protein